jgi:hypothetical protein
MANQKNVLIHWQREVKMAPTAVAVLLLAPWAVQQQTGFLFSLSRSQDKCNVSYWLFVASIS